MVRVSPGLTSESLAELTTELTSWLVVRGQVATTATVVGALGPRAAALDAGDLQQLVHLLQRETVGLGPLQELAEAPGVTDVLVNPGGQVWVDDGGGLRRTGLCLGDEQRVRALAVRLATRCGRRLDDAVPWVDGQLPGGLRLHAVLPPVSAEGTVLSLRIPPRQALALEDLQARGTFSAEVLQLVRALVDARLSLVVTGGTGSGKTTLLAALLGAVGPTERVVLVEDAPELQPASRHVVRLQSRAVNVEGAGEVSLQDLVRQALRMRPDRLVVGEVRGAEVLDLLAALNTGHEGGATTVHANTAGELPARFEALALRAGMTREATHAQLAAGVQVVLHMKRKPTGRRLTEVGCLVPAQGLVAVVPAVAVDDVAGAQAASAADHLADLLRRRGVPVPNLLLGSVPAAGTGAGA